MLSRKRRHGPLSIGYRRYISWLQFFPSTISAKFSHFLSVRYLRAISVTNLVGCSEACDCCQYFSPENTNDLLHQPDYRRRKRGDRSSRLINALILVCCIKNMMKNSAALWLSSRQSEESVANNTWSVSPSLTKLLMIRSESQLFIDVVGEPDSSALRYHSPTVTGHTSRDGPMARRGSVDWSIAMQLMR